MPVIRGVATALARVKLFVLDLTGVISGVLMIVLGLDLALSAVSHHLGAGLTWPFDLSTYLLVWVVALGLGFTYRMGDHVNMEALVEHLPASWRWAAVMLSTVCSVVFALVLVVYTAMDVLNSMLTGEVSEGLLRWPVWPSEAGLVVGGLLLLASALLPESFRAYLRKMDRRAGGD